MLTVELILWGMLQHGFHGIWGFSHTLVVMVTVQFRPFGCHGKQMKILGRPTCDSITRWQQNASWYFRVVRTECTIGGIRAWFVRKVAPHVTVSAPRIMTTFLAFCDVRWYSFSIYLSGCQVFFLLSTKRHLFTLLVSHVATEQDWSSCDTRLIRQVSSSILGYVTAYCDWWRSLLPKPR